MYKPLLIIIACLFTASVLAENYTVRHYQQQARYMIGNNILQLALSKTGLPYQVQTPQRQSVNEARGELQVISGELDLQWAATSTEREDKMIPIKIPIYRGILGLRLLLVNQQRLDKLDTIKSLKDLQAYVGGHGTHWKDLPVYSANNLKVRTSVAYESLFKQLESNRFDYFHRGINEIWDEQKRYPDTLAITNQVMLYYPLPVYFFVSKNRPKLASDLKRGLELAINDGSYKKLFYSSFQEHLNRAKLKDRHLVILNNPNLPKATPPIDTSWWLPKKLHKN